MGSDSAGSLSAFERPGATPRGARDISAEASITQCPVPANRGAYLFEGQRVEGNVANCPVGGESVERTDSESQISLVRPDEWINLAQRIGVKARPRVIPGMGHHPRPHRILL